MRISTAQLFRQSVDAMLERQRDLGETELQVASGKRIVRPSDDPSASVRVLDLQESAQRLAQFQRNADAATAKLAQEETALQGVENILQRVRELTVQGNSDTYNLESRRAIALEVRALMDNFLQLANTRDANGEYIYGGFRSNQPPFVAVGNYSGDEGQRRVQIGETREVVIGDPGSIFTDLATADTGDADGRKTIYQMLDALATNLEAGSGDAFALTDLDTALGRVIETRAKVGARMNAIDEQKVANSAFEVAVADVKSTLQDLDYAEAISRFNQQLTALQASQQAFIKVQDLSLFNFIR